MTVEYDLSDETASSRPTALAPCLFRDQVVIVTGGGSGIGRAIAWLAARLGANVLIFGRKAEKVERVAAAIGARGLSCAPGVLDIRDRAAVDVMFADVVARHGRVDVLINNAGGHFPSPAIDLTEKGWRAVIDNNLTGTFNMMQAAARHWRQDKRGGVIVNITIATRGIHHLAHSQASRAGVVAFTQSAAVEWAELGIRINCIAPGSIVTETWRPEERELYAQGNPMRRAGTMWEVAELVLFTASPSAAFINGQSITIDGGMALWGEAWSCGKPQVLRDASRRWDEGQDLLERWRQRG
jgi:citronellol/citronellal dehydrogenase